jgi:hypothetical protein
VKLRYANSNRRECGFNLVKFHITIKVLDGHYYVFELYIEPRNGDHVDFPCGAPFGALFFCVFGKQTPS